MKKSSKIIAMLLVFCTAFFAVACNADSGADIGTPPDYSSASGQMEFYGYHSVSNGTWGEDGKLVDVGTDYRTVERFKEHLESGLNLIFMQGVTYNGEDWEESALKNCMDMALEAGIERSIIADQRLYDLSQADDPIVGSGARFETTEELDAFVANCMKDYSEHGLFYGLLLRDEPTYKMFGNSAAVYKSIKKYAADNNVEVYVKQNLLPLSSGVKQSYCENSAQLTLDEAYIKYLTDWQAATGADYIMFDDYPILANGIGSYYIKGLKLAAEFCKEKSLDLYVVAQTTAMLKAMNPVFKKPGKNEMYWQLNMLLGFGVKRIAYFTYWPKRENSTTGEWFPDGSSFISRDGEKTDLYYTMQQIHSEIQKFAPTLLSFEYNASSYFMKLPMNFATGYVGDLSQDELKAVKSVEVGTSQLVLVNEMYDKNKDNYMYMVQNILEPAKGAVADMSVSTTIEFDSKYNYVAVWYKGEVKYVKLNDHKYSTKLSAGYAEFLIPYV